jgi:hypothetical protein
MKGYFAPDPQLRKEKGYDRLYNLYTTNPIIFSSVNDASMSLFHFQRKDHFKIVCEDAKFSKFLSDLFIEGPIEGLFGFQVYDLASFFEMLYKELLIIGQVFFQIDFLENSADDAAFTWSIRKIGWLPPETMKVKRQGGKIEKFIQQYSDKFEKQNGNSRVEFCPEEILFVQWIFDGQKKKGLSPLIELDSLEKKYLRIFDIMTKKAYIMAHPDDKSSGLEKAKFASWEKEKKLNEITQAKIKTKIGTVPDYPMTDYYTIYKFAESRRRTAIVREYLLEQFNLQIIDVLTAKNNFHSKASISINGYLSSNDIRNLFEEFHKGKLAQKEILNQLSTDMIGKQLP